MKFMKLMVLGLIFAVSAQAADVIDSIINDGNTGSASATVVVKPARGWGHITDLNTRVDANNTSATVDIRQGVEQLAVTSSTSGSGTVLWFANSSPTRVAVSDYLLFNDVSAKTYTLLRTTAVTSTSATVETTISVALSTSDFLYTLASRIRRPITQGNASQTSGLANIYVPANMPSVLTIDGNTTSCQISISGERSLNR